MKFLLNVNLPRELGGRIASAGHEWRHAADLGLERAPDTRIIEEALHSGECILTLDLDYGQLLAFSGGSAPSVVIFRLRRANVDLIFERLTDLWDQIEQPLAQGALVTIEEAALRIHSLPIVRG